MVKINLKNTHETNVKEENFSLYQLQIEGLKNGWLIYPKTLNPLTLTIRRKEQKTASHSIF